MKHVGKFSEMSIVHFIPDKFFYQTLSTTSTSINPNISKSPNKVGLSNRLQSPCNMKFLENLRTTSSAHMYVQMQLSCLCYNFLSDCGVHGVSHCRLQELGWLTKKKAEPYVNNFLKVIMSGDNTRVLHYKFDLRLDEVIQNCCTLCCLLDLQVSVLVCNLCRLLGLLNLLDDIIGLKSNLKPGTLVVIFPYYSFNQLHLNLDFIKPALILGSSSIFFS